MNTINNKTLSVDRPTMYLETFGGRGGVETKERYKEAGNQYSVNSSFFMYNG